MMNRKEVEERKANLRGADLHGANLHGADLREANLHGADLREADLHGANLHGANLHGADLREADLHGANLHGANLRGANLRGADLHGADLRGAKIDFYNFPSLRTLSSMQLGHLSDKLTLELMIRDAQAHPNPSLFDEWADGWHCPYKNEERYWLFEERREVWKNAKSKRKRLADRDLIIAICKEKGWGIRGYL